MISLRRMSMGTSLETETQVAIGRAVYGTPHTRSYLVVKGREEMMVLDIWRRREG